MANFLYGLDEGKATRAAKAEQSAGARVTVGREAGVLVAGDERLQLDNTRLRVENLADVPLTLDAPGRAGAHRTPPPTTLCCQELQQRGWQKKC